jgi:hypothetical protein
MDKEQILQLIQNFINDGSITYQDLIFLLQQSKIESYEAKRIKEELERWYKELGIESITKRNFSLSNCPFTIEEIEKAYKEGEIILCVPAGLTLKELGNLFHINSWALEDPLYAEGPYKEDFWFRTPMTYEPPYVNISAKEARRIFEDEGKLGFSLARYLVFASRVKYLTGKLPDQKWWTWLLAYKYDRSGFLIAGFDPEGKFSVHGWMPNFKAKFVGARYIKVPERG